MTIIIQSNADLAGGGYTRVQHTGTPGFVPSTGGHNLTIIYINVTHHHDNATHLPVLVAPRVLEAAVRAAGVGDARLVADVPVPLPGAALRTLGRRVGAVDS